MENGKVVYFGAGGSAIAYCKNSRTLPDFFIDNDASKWGTLINGVEVLSPEVLADVIVDKIVLTTSFLKSVYPQILSLGVPEEKIFVPAKSMWSSKIFADESVRRQAAKELNKIFLATADEFNLVAVGGTALGFARDGDFIPWDDDIDLFAPVQMQAELRNVLGHLQIPFEEQKDPQGGYFLFWLPLESGEKIDGCVKFFDADSENFIDTFEDYTWEWPTKMFTQCAQVLIHGKPMNIPNPPEVYLREVYGPTWAEPNPEFTYSDYSGEKA